MKITQAITIVLAFAALVSIPFQSVNSAASSGKVQLMVVGSPDFSESYMEAKGEKLSTLEAGDLVLYRLVVKNTGNADSHNTILISEIPEFTTYISGSATGTSVDDSQVLSCLDFFFPTPFFKTAQAKNIPFLKWNLGTILAGESTEVSYKVKVDFNIPSKTLITNNAYIESDEISKVTYSALTSSVTTGERIPYLVYTGKNILIFSIILSLIIATLVVSLYLVKKKKKGDTKKTS
jgi:uncharacterized repeat protein (TIGR01451 family)